jgi:NADPH:quinone reductase-like Zn-dependent oxidoreductase
VPVTYGDGVEDRIRATSEGKVDAFIDTFGGGYVELALGLGVNRERIDTIIDFGAAEKYNVKAEGNSVAATAEVLGKLAGLMAAGRLEIPIAKVYPLAEVQAAYRDLEERHTQGKIVLKP